MRAALYASFAGPITITNVDDPTPPRDGVVIEVRATGVCRSDWHGWMGHDPDIRLPHVPGHELAGVVAAAGPDVTRWRVGDRVTVPFAVGCGRCPTCRRGDTHICDNHFQPGFTAWGSFASAVAIPYADINLVALPADVDFVEAASLGCRFATAYRAVRTQGRVREGEWVAVHGCGGVGLSAIMIARALGARTVAVDVEPETLTLARSLGADMLVDARGGLDVPMAVRDGTGGGAHVSLDALGSRVTCRNSIACLRKRGRHVQVGLMVADDRTPPIAMDQVIARELEILGSHGLPADAYGSLMAMIEAGRLRPRDLVHRTVTLEQGVETLVAMGRTSPRGVVVIEP
ncbi:MAG: zinc-dependent alcohol dehydrogenase family protein [Phycisphaerales bacterium]|nr:zinc-dependent alcohol dehydrogenase family protein [Phycisphaerales bacterium]